MQLRTEAGCVATAAAHEAADIVTALSGWAKNRPDMEVLGFLGEGEIAPRFVTYADLHRRASVLAHRLLQCAMPGDRVIVLHQPGIAYVVALLACLYAGLIAVPAYPPRPRRGLDRLRRLLADASCTLAVTAADIAARLAADPLLPLELQILITDGEEPDAEDGCGGHEQSPGGIAYLQYTSGSTSDPRGVIVTHANLMHNVAMIQDRFRIGPASRGLIWLPPYHDMGLVGGILTPLVCGFPCLLMSPAVALRKPLQWLQWIGRFGGTISGGPDFAYRHAAHAITEEQKAHLDLSTWEVAFCGAEPIRPSTLEAFTRAFAPCGFRADAFHPCYGLAEATLMVTGTPRKRSPRVETLDPERLAEGQAVQTPNGKGLVSCGAVSGETIVKIIASDGRALPERQVGEIWVSGPAVASGYWMNAVATASTFGARPEGAADCGPFLRTGDLGFLDGGELYVTGRIKDLLIVRGRKIHPQDVEEAVAESLPDLRHAVTAAFAIDREGGPAVALAVELGREASRRTAAEFAAIAAAIRHAVGTRLDVAIGPVAFLDPGMIPRTSSGKLQRYRCAELFDAGGLDARFVHDERGGDLASTLRGAADVPAGQAAIGRDRCGAMVDRLLAEAGLPAGAGQLALDSLQVVHLGALIDRDFGVHLTAGELFAIESRGEVVDMLVDRAQAAGGFGADVSRLPEPEAAGPLSAGQRAMWFIDSLTDDTAAYNTPFAARIKGRIDIDALRSAVDSLPRRHSALRVKYCVRDGEPTQVDSPAAPVPWHSIDAAGWSDDRLDEALAAAARVPFRLADDPPLRAHLFRRSDTDHVLLLNTHHIRVDFWSFQIMLRDILAAVADDHGQAVTDSVGHYSHFVRWQREYLASREAADDRQYWRTLLDGSPVLSLPLDRPHPPEPRLDGDLMPVRVDAGLAARLEAFERDHGLTAGMVLLGAYGLLLATLSGQEDLVVGMPFSGRTRTEFADTVGYFVNPLPMRLSIRPDDTVASYLRRVRDRTLEALEHQNYPSALMARDLDATRDAAGNTLFQTMLVLNRPARLENDALIESRPEGLRHLGTSGVEWTEYALPQRHTKFDLVLAARDACGRLEIGLQYNTAVFDRETVARHAASLALILRQMVVDGDAPLVAIDPLPPDQWRRVTDWGSGPRRDYDLADPIHRRIERQVAAIPESVAVICDDRRLSYGELNSWANAVASRLRELGAGPGRFVGVLVDRSLELPVANLAVMKSGAAFVPLDVDWPLDRLQRIVRRCNCITVVATEATGELAARIGPEVTTVEDGRTGEAADAVVAVDPEDPVYAFSTSGSTGEPKVAVIPHRGIANRFAWMDEFFGPAAARSVLQTTRQVYDSAVWQLFWPLVNGGTTVVPSADAVFVAEQLTAMIAAHRVTMTDFVPSVFNALVPQLGTDAKTAGDLASLRVVILGGEEITPETTRQFMSCFPGVRVVNLYGPTEASIGCIACDVEPGGSGRIPIGRPIANVKVSIVDRAGRPVPVGTVGEIWIGGAAVGLGYASDPEATARAFTRDASTGGLLYKTGDLARWLPDGTIDFRGRLDDQVKIRGHRIELAEIEGVLRQHPDVKAAFVTLAQGAAESRSLVAYVAAAPGGPGMESLSSWMRERLPSWMVPAQVVVLDELPLTSSGKVDRRALPPPTTTQRPHRPPESKLERQLAALWCRVLRTEVAGLDDDFFESGGDSLLAAQLMSLVQKECEVSLPLRQLFIEPTLGRLASLVSSAQRTSTVVIPRASGADDRSAVELLANIDSLTDAEVVEITNRLMAEQMHHDNA